MRAILTLLCLVNLATWSMAYAPPAADDGYESENTAKGVKTPRVAPPPVGKPGGKDDKKENKKDDKRDSKKEDKAIPADDIDQLKKLEKKDAAVVGKVHEVFVNRDKTVAILNFGPNHRECFKAVIFSRNWTKWDKGVEEIKSYKGKVVTVSGPIGIRDDMPQIIVAVPSQVKAK